MLFELARFLCTTTSGLQAVLCWRLLKQGWKLNFINLLFAIQFFVNTVNNYIFVHFFFKIGFAHFFVAKKDPDDISEICKYYISSWLLLYIMGSIPCLGIFFCRFIYVRYAHGLVADMGRLFHKVVLLMIAVFTIQWLLVWSASLKKDDYKNILKGKICNQMPFPEPGDKIIELHVKPKLMTCAIGGLYCLSLVYIHASSKKKKARYSIPRRRWNLLNIDQHAFYLQLIHFCIQFDQVVINVIIQVFHSQLGVESVFLIWWTWHLVMFLITNMLAPLTIDYLARREYPEYKGLQGRRFPGQEKPRAEPLLPDRTFLGYESRVCPGLESHQAIRNRSQPSQPSCSREVALFTSVEVH